MGIREHGGEGMIHLQNVQRGQEGQGFRGPLAPPDSPQHGKVSQGAWGL